MLLRNEEIDYLHDKLDPDSVNLLLVAENTTIDIPALVKYSNNNGISIAGGIFPMVIYDNEHIDQGIVLKVIPGIKETHIITNINQGNYQFRLPQLPEYAKTCYVFLDGLMAGIPNFLERLYEKYWHNIAYIGAGCGSLSLKQSPCVFNNDGIFQNAGLIIFSTQESSLGVRHGWKKIAGPFVANKTKDNHILELNWRPAFDVYKEVVSQYSSLSFENNDFFSISKAFPFGIFREGKEDIVRDPIEIGDHGSLLCVGHVGQNVALNILQGNKQNLIENAALAVKDITISNNTKDLLVVDCISRVLYLEDEFDNELVAIKSYIHNQNSKLALEGVLSIGEISSGNEGYLELYNKTIVVSAFE